MPSQEEYLDNLLKGIETENTETEVTKEPKMTGTEEETAKAPETPEPVEESGIQVDMSDMDDLLQSALDAQKADSSEQETEASQPVAENTAILPEETASMSEDEINRLLQQSQEQSGDAPAQESNDANDDLIKMLENADDEGLSNILDQVTPETAQPEETAEREEDNGKRGKKKKEKPEKEDKQSVSEKKLSPKKILPIVVVCISLGAVILLLGNFLADYTAKRSGREAYYAGDYQTCYQNLMGKELDETEQVMYSQSESILTIRMWLREYEVFVNEGSELEALDSLLQAVRDYPTLLNYATQWNAQDEVSLAFQDILNILSQKYQLSQEEAQQIADISDNVEYTKNVMLVLQRLGLGFWEFPQGTVTEETSAPNTEEAPAQLPDPLPEEEEIQQ